MAQPSAAQPAEDDRFRTAEDVAYRQLDDQAVLVNLRTNRIFELNRTGARLWELLAGGPSEAQIIAQLFAEFEVSQEQLTREVQSLINALLEEGLIIRESQGT